MRVVMAVMCVSFGLAGCTPTLVSDRSLTVRAPVGNFGDTAGTAYTKNGVKPADTITLDLTTLILKQMGADGALSGVDPAKPVPIEIAIAKFDTWNPPDSQTKIDARNSIVSSVVWASDTNCLVVLQYMHGSQVLTQSLSSSLATIFSATATAFSPPATKSALSALATISSGVGSNIDSAAFAKQTLDVIAGAIEADRDSYKTAILEPAMLNTYAKWNLAQGLSAAEVYHNKCDAMEGLHYLQVQTASTNTPKGAAPQPLAPQPPAPPPSPVKPPAPAPAPAPAATT